MPVGGVCRAPPPFEPCLVVGLRLHILLFDHHGAFPTLSSNLWHHVMTANDARRKKEMTRVRPPPVNEDPAAAVRHVAGVSTLGKKPGVFSASCR